MVFGYQHPATYLRAPAAGDPCNKVTENAKGLPATGRSRVRTRAAFDLRGGQSQHWINVLLLGFLRDRLSDLANAATYDAIGILRRL
jgi:hypothetical protein